MSEGQDSKVQRLEQQLSQMELSRVDDLKDQLNREHLERKAADDRLWAELSTHNNAIFGIEKGVAEIKKELKTQYAKESGFIGQRDIKTLIYVVAALAGSQGVQALATNMP